MASLIFTNATPSTTKKGPDSTPSKVSFIIDPSLTQASAVPKNTAAAAAKKDYKEDIWLKEADGTNDGTGRIKHNPD